MVSIVIATHNRKRQLLNSLYSIKHTRGNTPIEVIIIDDNSEHKVYEHELAQFDFPIIYKVITDKKGKGLRSKQDPIVPINTGLSLAKGDIILLSCAEIAFMGNIAGHAHKYMNDLKYMCYSTFAVNWNVFHRINRFKWHYSGVIDKVKYIIEPLGDQPQHLREDQQGWYYHPVYKPLALPFCAALTRKNMERLAGYDERYQYGTGRADNDFVRRVNQVGLVTEGISGIYCIHQPHEATDYSGEAHLKNAKLFDELAASGNVKADQNVIYKR